MAQLMLVLIALTALFTASLGQSCGTSPSMRPNRIVDPDGQRIVGGVESRPHSHPWIVSLQSSGGSHFCGGTIVSEDTVVTAAHCVVDGNPGRIVAGAHDHRNPDSFVQVVRPVKVTYHEAYSSVTTLNDVAVIKVSPKFVFNKNVQPACLPAKGEQVPDNTQGTVAGWGLTQDGGYDTSEVLMQVGVPTIGTTLCGRNYRSNGITINGTGMLCGGYPQGGKDSCQGDSGGPFVFKNAQGTYTLQGVVSFGIGCAQAGYPGVYARVSSYVDWITNTAGGKPLQG